MKEVILVIIGFSLIALSSGAINAKTLATCLMATSILVAISLLLEKRQALVTQKRLKQKKLKKIINQYQKKT